MKLFFSLLTLVCSCIYSVKATSYHTISIDGSNDFFADEILFGTTGSTWYFTWDANNFYFGCNNDNIDDNDNNKWVHLYIDSDPTSPATNGTGTTIGINYNTQQPNLPFTANYHLRWKTNNSFTSLEAYTGTWGTGNNTGIQAFQSGQYVEFVIPRANLGNPTGLYVAGAMINEIGGGESTYYMTPNGNIPAYDANYTSWFGFNLTSGLSPNASGNVNLLLPVELIYFNISKEKNTSILSWQTVSELNNAHFQIQRSPDSRTWETIGKVEGHGTTHEPQEYHFTDDKPLSGMNYYRLQQVDFDGNYEYSKILSVEFRKGGETVLSPNPAGDELFIKMAEEIDGTLSAIIFDANGALQFKKQFNYGNPLNTSDLPSGVYFLKIENEIGEIILRERFIKK